MLWTEYNRVKNMRLYVEFEAMRSAGGSPNARLFYFSILAFAGE